MLATLLSLALLVTDPQPGRPAEQELKCEIGPLTTSLGGNDWLVYACQDGRSVVIAAGAPNPATPFFFIVRPDGDGINLYGKGTGDKSATEPAYNELKDLKASDLSALYNQAVAAGSK